MTVSLLFPARNRLEFTKQSWAALMANTDWSLVSEFHVYDDGSSDGTRQFIARAIVDFPENLCPIHFHFTDFHSPMGVTIDWIKRSKAPMLAKLDNDTIYPPGWLNVAMDVMKRHPELDTLGLECMRRPAELIGDAAKWAYEWSHFSKHQGGIIEPGDRWHGPQGYMGEIETIGYIEASHISGLGLYRRKIFEHSLPEDNGYFGFEEWMVSQRAKHGWILPSLPTILLDRLPIEPWKSLSQEYVRKGWQRPLIEQAHLAPGARISPAGMYKMEQSDIWEWWKPV